MQNSLNKSQQLNYSNCKLSPILFFPDTIQRERNDFLNLDNRNRNFLQSSIISRKMAIIEPNLGSHYFNKLKDLATPYADESNCNSKLTGKEGSRKRDENSVKKALSTFDHPWNTRNISFDSNQNFKACNNLLSRTNKDSAFKSHYLGNGSEVVNNKQFGDVRNHNEVGHITNVSKNASSVTMNNFNNIRPQVYSSILKIKKIENLICDDVPITNYINENNQNNKYKNFRNEKILGKNVNLTIINNNNYSLKNVVREENKRGRKGKGRKESSSKFEDDQHNDEEEWNPKFTNKMNNIVKGSVKPNRVKNWKKIIEICNEANEFSNNVYNTRLLNKKKNRHTDYSNSSFKSNRVENSESPIETADYFNKDKISTNIITKRILMDKLTKKLDESTSSLDQPNDNQEQGEKRLFKSENKRKLKRFKKSENVNIKLESTHNNLQVNYSYLFEPFQENSDIYSSCNFINEDLKKEYTHYLTYGRSNEHNLTFGDNPLTIYQNLAEWFNREIKKNSQNTKNFNTRETLELCEKIVFEMNDISKCISTLPIFMFPSTYKSKASNKVIKYKKRKKFDESGPIFTCEVCNQKFNSGQGLGGHMSRKHPKTSEKFLRKKEIRKKREEHRNILYEAKKRLLLGLNLDYEELRKNREGKKKIKEIVKKNKEAFKSLRLDVARARKKEKNLKSG